MSRFERWLTVRVAPCILARLALGNLSPELSGALTRRGPGSAKLVAAGLIRAMVCPMMIAVDPGLLGAAGQCAKRHAITPALNRLILPVVLLCRPSEAVLDLLEPLPSGPVSGKGGTPLIDAGANRVGDR